MASPVHSASAAVGDKSNNCFTRINIPFIYPKFFNVGQCAILSNVLPFMILMRASSLSWQLQEQECFFAALLLMCLGDCDYQDHYICRHVLKLSLIMSSARCPIPISVLGCTAGNLHLIRTSTGALEVQWSCGDYPKRKELTILMSDWH